MTAADLLRQVFPWEAEERCVEGVGADGEAVSAPSAERPPVAPPVGPGPSRVSRPLLVRRAGTASAMPPACPATGTTNV